MPPERANNAGHAFALVLVDELVRHGVREAVLAPGSRSTPIALALAGDERVRLHVRIDERSAAFLALGLTKASGQVVPVLCTSGTAAAHFLAAALEADQSHVPLLLLTADRPPELRGTGANQTIDQVGLYGGAVRWSADVGVPESRPDAVRYWRSIVSRAALTASGQLGGTPGPVHLNLPLREPLTPTDDGAGFPHPLDGRPEGRPWTDAAPVPDGGLPIDVRDVIVAARRGVIVAGDGLSGADVNGVLDFAAARGWPVIAEPHSNARRGPNALSATDALIREPSDVFAPDLVVVAGRIGLSRALLAYVGRNRNLVIDGLGRWPDPTRTASYLVAAPPAGLRDVRGEPAGDEWLSGWQRAATAVAGAIDAILDSEPALTEPLVAREVAASAPDGTALVVASSMPIRDLDLTMRPRDGIHIYANRGVSGIDGFVSTAAGIALAHKGKTIALAGDLSLLHDVNGLLIRDGYPIDLTLVVVNNDGGGIFSLLPQADASGTFERLFGTPHGVDLAGAVTAYGATHRLVQDAAELRTALAGPGSGLRVVEVRTDRAANAELHRRLAALSV
ncbi:MAG: 2-succinyl-5-enolpyruvyl-6-hydroxy-3-cyclohexene-carboxylate synthase [Frankiaceae bacterium]|jgi:2-succinyl-5-enolpyruvyl-6-hydroxy-3-cyclohexene-1-carboxylate synthase|nr:2-succinyl-5-enolpyruvyl-6-hydroxy-3-cyclohexene-carboxylate synthase [Frankiaceae bacterium]